MNCPYCSEAVNEQPEQAGVDFFGDEILVGDPVMVIEGETILVSNTERYLRDALFAEFKKAQ